MLYLPSRLIRRDGTRMVIPLTFLLAGSWQLDLERDTICSKHGEAPCSSAHGYGFLNSGAFAGPKKAVLRMLREVVRSLLLEPYLAPT